MAKKESKRRVEMIGSEAELDRNGPLDMRQSAFPGGVLEMIGSEAELVHKTTPMGVFDKHVRGGEAQWVGSKTEDDRTPRRSWQSYPSPFSDNSENEQEVKSSFPGSHPTRMRE